METKLFFTSYSREELIEIFSELLDLKLQNINFQNNEVEEEYIRIDDVVKLLKVSEVTIHTWKRNGLLPFHKISGRLRFKKNEVLSAVKEIKLGVRK